MLFIRGNRRQRGKARRHTKFFRMTKWEGKKVFFFFLIDYITIEMNTVW